MHSHMRFLWQHVSPDRHDAIVTPWAFDLGWVLTNKFLQVNDCAGSLLPCYMSSALLTGRKFRVPVTYWPWPNLASFGLWCLLVPPANMVWSQLI